MLLSYIELLKVNLANIGRERSPINNSNNNNGSDNNIIMRKNEDNNENDNLRMILNRISNIVTTPFSFVQTFLKIRKKNTCKTVRAFFG